MEIITLQTVRDIAAAALASLLALPAAAQSTDDELSAQATDPTASLMSFQLNDWYTASFHGTGGSANQVVFRTAIPFALGGHASHLPASRSRTSRRRRRARRASPTPRSST